MYIFMVGVDDVDRYHTTVLLILTIVVLLNTYVLRKYMKLTMTC